MAFPHRFALILFMITFVETPHRVTANSFVPAAVSAEIVLLGNHQEKRLVSSSASTRKLSLTSKEVLETLYISTVGSSWTNRVNWMNDTEPCPDGNWYGITCSGSNVVRLALSSNNLVGSLPSEIGMLTATSGLQLDRNSLDGLLPSQIGQLSLMKTIFGMNSNSFSSFLPSELGLLTGIDGSFSLNSNRFSGSIPSELGQLTIMNSGFSLAMNSLNGYLPSQLGLWTSFVTSFDISSNQLSGTLPSEIGQLTSLSSSFSLESNGLNGKLPSELGQITMMKQNLLLSQNSFFGSIPSQLGQLTLFQNYLKLFSNSFSGSIPSELGRLTKISFSFLLHSNQLTDVIPSQLGRMSLLRSTFQLNSNSLSGSIPSELGQLTGVYSLFQLKSNKLTSNIPSQLGCMSQLSLTFQLNSNSLSGSIPSELGQLSAMYSVFQLDSNNVGGSIPSELGQWTLMYSFFQLNSNKITSNIPSQLGRMSLFASNFQLNSNSLSGSIPSELGQLTNINNVFQLNSNRFCGDVPVEVSMLSTQVSSGWDVTTGNTMCTYDILSTMYHSTSGDGWTSKDNWMNDTGFNPCSSGGNWYGVSCSGSEVVGLNLASNNLQGTLPSQLGILTTVVSGLRFSENILAGLIPSELGKLTALSASFYLSANQFSGSIPSELGRLTAMSLALHINGNSLSGSIPSELGQLTDMTFSFQLSSNSLSGMIPSELGLWTKLTSTLLLNDNHLYGSVPSELGQITLINQYVWMFLNSLSGSIPSEFGLWTRMTTELDCSSNNFTGSVPSQLGSITGIKSSFNLYSNKLSGNIPSELGMMTEIGIHFSLSKNTLSGSIPSQLGMMTSMTNSFDLSSNFLCGSVPVEILALSSQVTSNFNIVSGNSLGTSCCESLLADLGVVLSCAPTAVPTWAPTLIPASLPTFIPTIVRTAHPSISPSALPTPEPSPLPTMLPTHSLLPTSSPSPSPTPLPTARPTPSPSLIPSPTPSLLPTSVPTVSCSDGSYFAGSSCLSCPVGQYSYFNNTPPYPTTCTLCPVGQYNTQSSAASCTECAVGKLSSSDRTFCRDCGAGEYNYNNTECIHCEYGKYAPQALTDSCLECEAGSHTNNRTGATTCNPCDAGTYSVAPTHKCSNCLVGKYSPTGQSSCLDCDAGKYTNQEKSSSCSQCGLGTSSFIGSDKCDVAAEDYYIDSNGETTECPRNALCLGGYNVPIPHVHYWVMYDKQGLDEHYGDIYKCSRDTCKGGSSNSTCWKILGDGWSLNSTQECNIDDMMCSEGATGVLCGSCLSGYVYQSTSNQCGACEGVQLFMLVFIAVVLLILALAMVYFKQGDQLGVKNVPLIKFLLHLDGGSLKVLWVTYQIVVTSSFTLSIEYPSPFSGMLSLLSVFSLDFLALECLNEGPNAYYYTVILWCILPIILAFNIVLTGVFRAMHSRYMRQFSQEAVIKSQHIWFLLFLSYLVLPPVANKQLQAFDCINVNGERYLRSDTAIDCNTSQYTQFSYVVLIFIFLYQFIPISWMILLYRKRSELNPHTANQDEKLAMFIRDQNPDLAPLRFLFVDYKCEKWWFEIADMYRRIVFLGIVPLVSPQTSVRSSFACVLAIISIIYFREEQPYRTDFTNVVAHIAQITILGTFYSALSLDTGAMVDFGLTGLGLGVFLVVVNLLIAILAFWFAWSRYKADELKAMLRESKALMNEDAREFSSNKFNTTFDAIRSHSIPTSHVMVFYYTSFKAAQDARKSGIVAHSQFNGIPLTLRDPTSSAEVDFEVFNGIKGTKYPREEVLLLSLPKQYLDPLPGFEDDPALCMISAEVLSAMRPSTFTAVVDSSPWLKGLTLLPPQCIVRSFWIMDLDSRRASLLDSREDDRLVKDVVLSSSSTSSSSIPVPVMSVTEYTKLMLHIRQKAFKHNLAPLFHYTSLEVAQLILKGGLRMSTQGQGDGGVYVSTLGPASYELGTPDYELNLIKDCFGVERVDEYLGKGRLDVVIIYGCNPYILEQAPGGRDNARMVTKSSFSYLSMENSNGNYFLRPDRILGMFHVNPRKSLSLDKEASSLILAEKMKEKAVLADKLEKVNQAKQSNMFRIGNAYDAVWMTEDRVVQREQKDDDLVNISAYPNMAQTELDFDEEIGVSMEDVFTKQDEPSPTSKRSQSLLNRLSTKGIGKRKSHGNSGGDVEMQAYERSLEKKEDANSALAESSNPMLRNNEINRL